jgi:hypothetical protein
MMYAVVVGVVVGVGVGYMLWCRLRRPLTCVVHPVTNLDWSYNETREDSGEVDQEQV